MAVSSVQYMLVESQFRANLKARFDRSLTIANRTFHLSIIPDMKSGSAELDVAEMEDGEWQTVLCIGPKPINFLNNDSVDAVLWMAVAGELALDQPKQNDGGRACPICKQALGPAFTHRCNG